MLASRGLEKEALEGATGFLGQQPDESGDPLISIMKRGAGKMGQLKEAGNDSKMGVGWGNLGDVNQAAPDLLALLQLGFGTHYLLPGITDVQRAMSVVTCLITLGTAPEE